MRGNFLCIPDLHIPFEHPDALAFCKAVDRIWFPGQQRTVVCLGDEVDSHSISRYMPDPDGRSPRDELEEARKRLKDWYREFPAVRVCVSNHTVRPWKRAYEVGLPKEFMKSVAEVYEAPKLWTWADRWVIDGIVFEHGENVSGAMGALKAAQQNHMSTVIGHLHSFAGVIHAEASEQKGVWAMNSGCLIDVNALAFNYAKTYRNKPVIGCGVVKGGQPFFVPMRLGTDGRWVQSV